MKLPRKFIACDIIEGMVRDAETGHGVIHVSQLFANEIVKRWNAYSELLEQLKKMRASAFITGTVPENGPIIECDELIKRLENT